MRSSVCLHLKLSGYKARSLQGKSERQLEALALTAGQVIGDMEETPAIADVPLLCSAVLLKDEVVAMLEHKRQQPGVRFMLCPCLASSRHGVFNCCVFEFN